ncbi:MAG: L-histidine N(alpha)-methyltransferase [Alphaproteobacteria bacterium]|nr:L-histidine N(alpha)-methyltransferase [Alphaproteobacteria bacterium]
MRAATAGRAPEDAELVASVLEGLGTRPKRIASKWLYDAEGSQLFDRICELDAYYPTRTETGILEANAARLAAFVPERAALVELGSGSSAKTRILLDALDDLAVYVPVDISGEHLRHAAAGLAADYPRLPVWPAVGDFTAHLPLPGELRDTPKLLFFPGSTLGNLEPDDAVALLRRLRDVANVAGFVIGIDLEKDVARLRAAYDDPEGVTAAFNTNLLVRLNRELGAGFDASAFVHEARWNAERRRIEMHLVSRRAQVVRVAGRRFAFEEGESIHTENSHKYTLDGFADLAARGGWRSRECWVDDDRLFSVHLLVPAG